MRMTSVAVVIIFLWKVLFRKYLITAMFIVLSEQLQGTLTSAFERHLTTEDFTDMNRMNIGVELVLIHLTYYCLLLFLSNKPSF